jgi:HK97 family phage prohead protease
MKESQAQRLLGVPEWRGIDDYEVRKAGDEFVVRGYASLFDSPYPVAGGPERGGFTETVDKAAFDVTLRSKPDVHFLINHEGVTLARTKSGTLTLSTDNKGLLSEARIDRRDPMGQALEIKMERGDLDEMSFAFRTMRDEWDDDYTERRLLEVNIDKGDVSVVNNGANDKTRIRIADARDAISVLSSAELVEVRGIDNALEALTEARDNLDRLITAVSPKQQHHTLSVEAALRLIDGVR